MPGRAVRSLRRVLTLGKWIFIRTAALTSAFALAGAVATRSGDEAIAAHQIADQLLLFLALVLDSIAIAGQIIVGRELGAGRAERAYGAERADDLALGRPRRRVRGRACSRSSDVLPRAFTDDGVRPGSDDAPLAALRAHAAFRRCRVRARRDPHRRERRAVPRHVHGRAPSSPAPLCCSRRSQGDWGIRGVWSALVVLIVVRLVAHDDPVPAWALARHRLGIRKLTVERQQRPRSGRL